MSAPSIPMILWPHQQFALDELPRRIAAGQRRILLTSPTGGGKTTVICRLITWALERDWGAVLYTNRRLLIDQLGRVLSQQGIAYGVRASGHADELWQKVQVSSLPTERSRVLEQKRWTIHGQGRPALVLVDEAHLNGSETAQKILGLHREAGHAYVGLTATPIGLSHLYETLVVAGTPSQLRACGALVPAHHFGPDEPDMRRFRPNVKTGEYSENDVRKAIMTKCVFARVLQQYQILNPQQRPTILFAPGVAESIWFAEQFTRQGISAAHIDGQGIWQAGEFIRGGDRDAILQAVRLGEIKVLCNRFVCREGLDLPEVSHLILATVMGSLQTYLQSAGRGLRKAPGKDLLTIQDHGGHWWRHGSVNADRHWQLTYTETMLSGLREQRLRQRQESEPIHCPQCGLIRASGSRCPACGHESRRRTRMVVQTDGTLKEHTGDIFRPRVTRQTPNTHRLWRSMVERARRSRTSMTFRQAEALFFQEQRYWPPRNLPLMPRYELDWFRPVKDVPPERLL